LGDGLRTRVLLVKKGSTVHSTQIRIWC